MENQEYFLIKQNYINYILYKQKCNACMIYSIMSWNDDYIRRCNEYNYTNPSTFINKYFLQLTKHLHDLENKNKIVDPDSDTILLQLAYIKKELRLLQPIFAGIIVSGNWQSPAINSSTEIRKVAENIENHNNEYKRDRSYETRFLEEQLSQKLFGINISNEDLYLNVTSSGMGALTVINNYIQCNIKPSTVLASSQIYFENALMLNTIYNDKVIFIDSCEEDDLIEQIFMHNPDVVFLDIINNRPNLPIINVKKIIEEVAKRATWKILFVSDITMTIGSEHLFDSVHINNKNVNLIVFGSLIKLPQLGCDRINIGFVISPKNEYKNQMLDFRTFTGTNISDLAAVTYPIITKDILQERVNQINYNCYLLSSHLNNLDRKNQFIQTVNYPGLSDSPQYSKYQELKIPIPFFNLIFKPEFNNSNCFQLFVDMVIQEARKNKVNIVNGTSFGFDNTSIYYMSKWDGFGDEFIRISPGDEYDDINTIKLVFTSAFKSFINQVKE